MDKLNDITFSLVGFFKSWIPWQSESANVSRDFWMPDHSCRVCYDCDTQFTVFNRRHHCRLCGRIFCAKCTTNSVPACCLGSSNAWDEWERERVRVCNYCFKQWEEGVVHGGNEPQDDSCHSPLAASDASSNSSGTTDGSTISICSMSFGRCEELSGNCSLSSFQSTVMHQSADIQGVEGSGKSNICMSYTDDLNVNQLRSSTNRSDDDYDDAYGAYSLDSKGQSYSQTSDYYGPVDLEGIQNVYESQDVVSEMNNSDSKSVSSSAFQDSYDVQVANALQQAGDNVHDIGVECEMPSSFCATEDISTESVDFENNGLFWLPPEPENEEDDRIFAMYDVDDDDEVDDDDDDDGHTAGNLGHLRNSGCFASAEYHSRDKSGEEQKKAVKNIVDGHFRALVSQLLQVENIPVDDYDLNESWLEIITALSWEAATLLKPDTSRGGGMDPGGYVKVKCIASGCRSESVVVKGVVCKKNVAHRRMTTRFENPRVMILGGALEYQRVSNLLSSFDTLLKQETDHLKMAVAKIDAHHPNVLLVEKSVSRYAQEYILAKDISLVLNIKRPLLERIARCTGSQIVPSIDHLSAQKMGCCEAFHVDKCFEAHGSAGQAGKKLTKTLMYFEGCPKPLGCTILLRGANGDELKKVKHVVQYGIFAAYHLALETSFLADEGASLPEHLFNEPITVTLPNKSLSVDRSISVVPGFTVPANETQSGEPFAANAMTITLSSDSAFNKINLANSLSIPADPTVKEPGFRLSCSTASYGSKEPLASKIDLAVSCDEGFLIRASKDNNIADSRNEVGHPKADDYGSLQTKEHESIHEDVYDGNAVASVEAVTSGPIPCQQNSKTIQDEPGPSKEEFPPSDHQSILVSLSSRCVWRGTVCERSHLFRIKYYGSFDKPLGRFLQDHLFDQSYRCRSCDMPSEAHVQCYTHRQGTLTISVKKLLEIHLPGGREGKIWMWHRCLRCPRTNGFPPATRRVIMSDAAWGLSFGKFLELSFSNHAAASRVASCGHSLHRDCLRFYGCGKMVACFRYASIDVYSVHLPPSKVEFNYEIQGWIQKEANEVVGQAEFLFSEVLNGIGQIADKKFGGATSVSGVIPPESRHRIAELEGVLQNEKREFQELHEKSLNKDVNRGYPALDILEINRLRRQLLFQSYMWDHRLVYAARLDDTSFNGDNIGCVSIPEEKTFSTMDVMGSNNIKTPNNAVAALSPSPPPFDPCRSSDLEVEIKNFVKTPEVVDSSRAISPDLICSREDQQSDQAACTKVSEQPDILEGGYAFRRAMSDSQFLNLSDTLDAAWTGESQLGFGNDNSALLMGSISVDSSLAAVAQRLALENQVEERGVVKRTLSPSPPPSAVTSKGSDNAEETMSWLGMPFLNFYRSLNKNFLGSGQKQFGGYSPMYVSSVQKLGLQGGAKWLLPIGYNDIVIPVYDDEPTSIISYALMSQDYHIQLSDDVERPKESFESASLPPLQDSTSFLSLNDSMTESYRNLDESISSTSGSRNSFMTDPLLYTKSLHIRVSFTDNDPLDEVKYTVTCYYAKHFDALRKMCCPSELDFIRSLSRCKKWGAQGGKSNVFFAKTLDDRFIIKQVTKTELESFIKFAPEYFKYLTEAISTKSPTCLAKILGVYQVTTKHLKGGKESKMDVLVMENLLFKRSVTRLYDLKGSSRSRYNPDASGSNKVLLDQNLIEAMPTSPIFVGNKAKRLLERAVWNDTAFLASVDVMDYSLLVGVDEEKHELVLGIIDFMRQYTWDKHLETWVKASGILGGPKNVSPTVISPKQYKKRFRKAMTTYFLMVPDQWSPPSILPSRSQTNLSEENAQGGSSVE